jgi:hypothetical protein
MRANPSLPAAPAGKSDPVPPIPPSINTQCHAFNLAKTPPAD